MKHYLDFKGKDMDREQLIYQMIRKKDETLNDLETLILATDEDAARIYQDLKKIRQDEEFQKDFAEWRKNQKPVDRHQSSRLVKRFTIPAAIAAVLIAAFLFFQLPGLMRPVMMGADLELFVSDPDHPDKFLISGMSVKKNQLLNADFVLAAGRYSQALLYLEDASQAVRVLRHDQNVASDGRRIKAAEFQVTGEEKSPVYLILAVTDRMIGQDEIIRQVRKSIVRSRSGEGVTAKIRYRAIRLHLSASE